MINIRILAVFFEYVLHNKELSAGFVPNKQLCHITDR